MIIFRILKRVLIDSFCLLAAVLLINPFYSSHGELAEAEDFSGSDEFGLTYPYDKTFTISAYYSPLPCQNKYVTGSYESDVRLNGEGVHSADGSLVYPGMVAAPKSYAFGMKMYIPGVGIVAVHDRGGAIVASNGEDGRHDRLDVWMGYGDKGLERALHWGKRTVAVTVYGFNDELKEEVSLADYSPDEASPDDCDSNAVIMDESEVLTVGQQEILEEENLEKVTMSDTFNFNLQFGDNGEAVASLQVELKKMNFLKIEPTNTYDEVTQHAVFKFQQSQGVVVDESSWGAGMFGPKTRTKLNEIIASRNYTNALVASATFKYTGKDFAFSDGFKKD